jgi:hemerythrin-like domain-containing protein
VRNGVAGLVTGETMNAFQLLKNDHQIVSGLFDQIESASGQAKTQLFTRLKSELDVHALIEEKIFYPALENKKESREITLEAYEEHKVVKDLLADLASGSSADEEWDAKLKVLRENVDHHVDEEEGELFDKANEVLSDHDLDRIGQEMEAEKARQLGQTPPRAGASKRGAAKSAGSKKKAGSPGVLSRLASFVGLGSSKKSTKGSAKGGKKKAAKPSKARGAKKSSGKAAPKKSGAKKSSKSAKSASKSTRGGSKGASKKSSKSPGASKRKTAGSKKR